MAIYLDDVSRTFGEYAYSRSDHETVYPNQRFIEKHPW